MLDRVAILQMPAVSVKITWDRLRLKAKRQFKKMVWYLCVISPEISSGLGATGEQRVNPRRCVRRSRREEQDNQYHIRTKGDLHRDDGGHVETQHHHDPRPTEPAIEKGQHRERFEGGQDEEGNFEKLRHQRMLKHHQTEVDVEGARFGRTVGDIGEDRLVEKDLRSADSESAHADERVGQTENGRHREERGGVPRIRRRLPGLHHAQSIDAGRNREHVGGVEHRQLAMVNLAEASCESLV